MGGVIINKQKQAEIQKNMDEIIIIMKEGYSLEEAAIKLDIDPSDVKKWYDKGWHKEGEFYIKFFKEVRSLKYSSQSTKTKRALNKSKIKSEVTELSKEQNQKVLNKFNNFLNSQDCFIDNTRRRFIKNKFNTSFYDYYSILNMARLIDEYNEKFIANEKNLIIKEFTDFLDSQEGFIDNSIKESMKEKYKKTYRDYYSILKMDALIENHNNEFIANERNTISVEFNGYLNSQEGFIEDSIKESFKQKYYREYCNYYSILNMGRLIDKHNNKIIENEKNIFLNEFNIFLDSHDGFIEDSIKECYKKKFNKNYYNYYDELNIEEIINQSNSEIINEFKKRLPDKYISISEKIELSKSLTYNFDINDIIEEHNNEFIERTLELERSYFDNIAGKSLDKDQIRAVLTDDDVTQIVAGAGTGKTMTIQAKVKYLIDKQNVSPSDILCISYSNSACNDLASKLEKTLGNKGVEVSTFHSVGNRILRSNELDSDVPQEEIENLIDNYFKEVIFEKPDLIKEVIEFFSYYYDIIFLNQSNLNLETMKYKVNKLDEFEEYLQEELGIIKNEEKEYVNSIYELIIANYLFIHNIDYKLSQRLTIKRDLFADLDDIIPHHIKPELIYRFGNKYKFRDYDYVCNFYLPEKDIYINLLNIKPNWRDIVKDKKEINEYLEKIDTINKKSETQILNIYDYGADIESVLYILEDNLNKFGFEVNELGYSELFNILIIENNLKEYNDFIKTVKTFINLFKGNAYNIDDMGNDISKDRFEQYIKENNVKYSGSEEKRNEFFLNIIEKIYEIYTQKINDNGYIDFNDMINNAVIALKNGAEIHNYKYIIVDEYQDTSHTRYNLLKEMQNSTGAKIVVVGDDWQSIYGFTGCDVSLFSNFEEYFENSKMVKIRVTYRNSQDLINVCGNFIQDNPNLIRKRLRSAKGPRNKPIKLVEYTYRAEIVLSLMSILDEISQKDDDAEILILGRNNGDKYEISCKDILVQHEDVDFTKIIYSNNPKLDIKFRTIHKSKGLQADYVIILNLNDKINGFPNKIVNDPILDYVENKYEENIDYPEERRLFYVALTRTENDVYVFYNSLRPSCFINDINKYDEVKNLKFSFSNEDIHYISLLLNKKFERIETDNICPKCNSGNVTLIINNERGTSGFKCSNNCGWDGGSYHNINKGEHARKISHLKYAKVCDWCHHMLVVTPRKKNPKIKFLGCNHFPICKHACSLPKDFEDIDYNIAKLDKTLNGVYYLHKYIPLHKKEQYSDEEFEITEKIWGYKDNDDGYLISSFTNEIMEAIMFLHNRKFDKEMTKIALLAVPSSKVKNTNSTMKKSINIIETWYRSGIAEQNFGCKKEIINCKDSLNRVLDVPTAHLGEGRANCAQHIKSMICDIDKIPIEETVFIILDDVTTSGETMKACKKMLVDKDVDKENIYCIAIGATVRDEDEI